MALTNYSELKTSIADFLNRDDLTSVIPTFIALAEAQINRDVRHWKMEKRVTGALDSEYSQLPTDWLETIQVHITGSGTYPLQLASRDAIADKRSARNDTSGRPKFYTHADSSLELFPTPDASYTIELLYYAEVEALSDLVPVTWLLQDAADVYLYGALIHSAPYLQEDGRAGVWAQMYSAAVQKLNQASEKGRMSGSGLTMKVRGLGGLEDCRCNELHKLPRGQGVKPRFCRRGVCDAYALCRAVYQGPSDTGGGSEVVGFGYARQSITMSVSGSAPTEATNTSDAEFPAATGSQGRITHAGVFDALTGGNLLAWATLTDPSDSSVELPQTIDTGDIFKIEASNLKIRID